MSRFSLDWSELSLQVMITFGHFLWQACVVGILLAIGQQAFEIVSVRARALRSFETTPDGSLRSANFRYTIACVAFFSLPICVIATFAWVHQSRGPIVLVASDRAESPPSPMVLANEAIPTMANSDIPVLPPPATPMNAEVPVAEPIEPPTLGVEPQTSSIQRIQAFAPYLLLAYTVGVGFMLARFLLSVIGSSRLRQTIQPITDVKLLRTIAEQCARVGLKRVPLVALCQRVSVPVVVGIVKPMILLPPALLCGLDPNQIAAILSHEIAHIRRYDLIVNFLQRIVEALLFFHPVTWWISRRVSIERENCCDDAAAACMGRLPYAGALLQMAELCIGNDRRRSEALATLSASGRNSTELGYRIRRLIGTEETTRIGFTRRSFTIGLAMISLLAVSLVAWGQSQRSQDEASADVAMQKVFTPEPIWKTKLAADDAAPEMFRISPIVVSANRVMSIEKDFDLVTGKEVESTFLRLPRKNVIDMTLDPIFRRKSSDRNFLVEVSVRGLGNVSGLDKAWGLSSCDIRVLRTTDGGQIGATIHVSQPFDGITSDVDVENGGDFLVLGMGNEVSVYRTETGQVETTMPVKAKRIDAVAISPDREWLVVSDQNDLHFWRWRDQAPVKTLHAGRKIDSLVFTPDGQYLAEGPDTREDIQIRDMRTLEVIASLKDEVGSPLMVSSMDITPDGRYLVAHNEVSVDQTKLTIPHRIHVWDLQSRGKPVFQIATGEWVRKVAFNDDGGIIVGEFSGAVHGPLLVAWKLPDALIHRKVNPPRDTRDRLGDGIQWSCFGDEDGLRPGARLILPKDGLKPGQPLILEYRLANVSTDTKTLKCYLNNGVQFTTLGHGNRISGLLDRQREPVTLTIEPGDVFIDTEHLVTIDTSGLEPGKYQAALGSAFANTKHEIPHRGSIPFTIVGESTVKVTELPKSEIHWGKPIAGLQVGARFVGDPMSYAIGETIQAELFVANVTDQRIACSVVLPHPGDGGWPFDVEDKTGSTIMFERQPPVDRFRDQKYVHLKLAPGAVAPITGEGVQISFSSASTNDAFPSTLSKVKFQTVGTKEEAEQLRKNANDNIQGSLVTQGGAYSATFEITLIRPEIPAMRLELETGNVPFTVLKASENAPAVDKVMMRTGRPSDATERITKVEGIVLDSEKRPIAGVPLSFLASEGDEEDAFKPIYLDADNEGRFCAEIPSRTFRVYFSSPNEQHASLGELFVRDGQAVAPSDGIETRLIEGKINVVATLPRAFQLRFDVISADSGQRVSDVAIVYKEDKATWNGEDDYETGAQWSPYQIIENGKQTFQASTPLVMGKAHVLIAAKGFELVQLKLNEELSRGQPVVKQVRVKSVSPVHFTLTTASGEPAAGAQLEVLHSKELRAIRNCDGVAQLNQFLEIDVQSDAQGVVRFPWPAFSEWTTYRFEHPAGYVSVRGKDLPKAPGDKAGVARTIPLVAYTEVKGTYLPSIGENEFLEVYRLDPNRNAVASEAEIVTLTQDGKFELTRLLQGWYSFVHRVRYTDLNGGKHTFAIGGYGPFELSNKTTQEITLGNEGRSVVGRLKILGGDPRLDTLTISVSSNTRHRSPIEPQGLDEASLKTWWDNYWNSEEGRQYHDASRRNYINAIGTDGRFHFPVLPAGKYKLRAGRAVGESNLLLRPEHEFEIPVATSSLPLDLGDVIVNVVNTASTEPMHVHPTETSHWTPARPLKVTVASEGSAKILDDHSVQLEGDVKWQEVSLQVACDKPTNVEEIRLEILPVDSPTGPQYGRGSQELMLFDVKPGIEDQTGKFTSLDFASCSYLQNPSDDTTTHCIDYLSDTGWKVPPLPADETAHELVLRFETPIALRADQRLTITVDLGSAKEIADLNRIRLSLRQRTDGEAMKTGKTNESEAPTDDDVTMEHDNDSPKSDRPETGTVVLQAVDADTGEPIKDVTFVKENAVREDWATPVGKSDSDGTVRIASKPLPGYFFSVLPVPEGYKVSSLDEVPAHVEVGSRVDYRFYLRKLGRNPEFAKNVSSANAAGNRFAEALRDSKQKGCRLVLDDMPGFLGQPVTFSFARDRAPLAERIFANGEFVRAAVQDELRYFEKADGKLAGKISELRDIQVVISSSTLPTAPATSWYFHFRTKDGIELKQEGFRIRFEDLDHWDLEIPSFLHPEF